MILLQRRKPKRRARQVRGEFVEGIGHLRNATTYAAAGARAKVAPVFGNALTAVGLRKRRRSRWPWIAGAVAVATAAGAAGVMVWRRNAENQVEAVRSENERRSHPEDYTISSSSMGERKPQMAGSLAD